MEAALTARFLAGYYQGHGTAGESQALPDLTRAHAALTQAAACGSQARADAQDRMTAESRAALSWLEATPPDRINVPPHWPLHAPGDRIAYRKEGVFRKEGKATNYKVTPRAMSDGHAIAGPLQWIWDDMPDDIAAVLDALCADVPHLGETTSVVSMTVEKPLDTTHVREPHATIFSSGGMLSLQAPAEGRLAELDAAHTRATGGKAPTAAQDKHSLSAMPASEPVSKERVRDVYFRPVETPMANVPWPTVVAVPVRHQHGEVVDELKVRVAVAAHRALVSRMGLRASSLVTGHFPEGAVQPANRLAIHYLHGDVPGSPLPGGRDWLLFLVPQDANPLEVQDVFDAIDRVHRITTREVQFGLEPEARIVLDGATFWQPLPADEVRTWEADPATVAERRIRSIEGIGDLDLSAVWSLGNTLRDIRPDLAVKDPAARWRAFQDAGVTVRTRALRTLHPRAFVHRTDRRHAVLPYRAEVDLGWVLGDRTIVAMGQSRHLGCGLLVPVDRPRPAATMEEHA